MPISPISIDSLRIKLTSIISTFYIPELDTDKLGLRHHLKNACKLVLVPAKGIF